VETPAVTDIGDVIYVFVPLFIYSLIFSIVAPSSISESVDVGDSLAMVMGAGGEKYLFLYTLYTSLLLHRIFAGLRKLNLIAVLASQWIRVQQCAL
jgi:hypothetical protein